MFSQLRFNIANDDIRLQWQKSQLFGPAGEGVLLIWKNKSNKNENLLHAVRCRDSSVKDMHKSVAIGKVAGFNYCGSAHGGPHAITWVYAHYDLLSMWCKTTLVIKKISNKMACYWKGGLPDRCSPHKDRCAWNICLCYILGWYCIVRLKSHYRHQIRLENGLSKYGNNKTI